MFQGQIGEISFPSPGKLGLLLLLALFSTRPCQKLGSPIQLKLFFQIGIEKGYPFKKFGLDKLKITVYKQIIVKRLFSTTFFATSHEKHLVI